MMKTNMHSQKFWLLLGNIVLTLLISGSASLLALDDPISVTLTLLTNTGKPGHSNVPPKISIVFGKPVKGFEQNEIQFSPPAVVIETFEPINTQEFKVTLASSDAEITMTIPAGVAESDTDPNIKNEKKDITVFYDTTSPEVTGLTGPDGNSTAISPIPITAVFSEKMYGFEVTDITVDKGSPADLTTNDSKTFTFNVRPTERGKVTITIPENVATDAAGNDNIASDPLEIDFTGTIEKSYAYLPIISKPFAGEATLISVRSQGLTSFEPAATVDFRPLFPDDLPQEIHIWKLGEAEPETWQPFFPAGVPLTLDETILGGQTFWVRFRTGTATTGKTAVTFFYLPNGDFRDQLDTAVWTLDTTLPVEIVSNNLLRLGHLHHAVDCRNVPLGAAIAAIKLTLPPNSDYKLFVEGTVYTYDKLPDPNTDQFDAFEIHLTQGAQQTVQRFGNSQAPLNCNTPRTVPINTTIPLSQFQGETTVSLQNWSRLDNFYNTYTEIETIWIGK